LLMSYFIKKILTGSFLLLFWRGINRLTAENTMILTAFLPINRAG